MTQWGLDTLFNPAKRHMDEEKRRLQATRQQVGDTSGGKRIDLESGKVRIGKAGRDADEADVDGAEDAAAVSDEAADVDLKPAQKKPAGTKSAGAKSAGAKSAGAKSAGAKPAAGDKPLTPAQIRAAERRRRRPS